MCNSYHIKKFYFFGIVFGILLPFQTFGFDLLEEITLKVKSIYDGESFNQYLNGSYSPDFSKDPFGDVMSDISDMSNNLKKSGEDYVKKSLNFEGCSMTNKEIRGILYYYVTGYRADLARSLKIEQGNYNSRKYEIDKKTVDKYCEKFSKCVDKGPANIETRCMEFFQKNYKAGEFSEKMKQNVQVSWLGADKYWNNTTEDSPYDIMEDLGILSKLLYMEAQDPIKPVFYYMPNFSNSEDALDKSDSSSASSNTVGTIPSDGGGKDTTFTFGGARGLDKSGGEGGGNSDDNSDDGGFVNQNSISPINPDESPEYDELLEGLGAYRLTSDGSEFYTNLCNRDEQESQIEGEEKPDVVLTEESLDFDNISQEQYQEILNYMQEKVDGYTSLSASKEEEVDGKNLDKTDFGSEGSAEELQARADEIKDCWKSCEGLRIDQKASCMVKCACGEINSPIFDPENTPGLGPIFMIRFCAVPAVDMRFSVGGKRIHSIEDGVREIYGVTDKLSREGRLGTWTQQYEFLDSSTKRINFADSFAFSIDVELVNIGNRRSKKSEQHQKQELKTKNENAQTNFGVKNSTITTDGRNAHGIILEEKKEDISTVNDNSIAQTTQDLEVGSKFSLDVHEDIMAIHNVEIESYRDLWLDQQGQLWENVLEYINTLKDAATFLKDSKKKCK